MTISRSASSAGVDDDPRSAGSRDQPPRHLRRAAVADVDQADRAHVRRFDRAAAAFGEELAQVGRRVAERGVVGELGLGHRHSAPRRDDPLRVPLRHASGLQVARSEQHRVVPATRGGATGVLQRVDLRQHMPAQRGVATADDVDLDVQLAGDLEHHPPQGSAERGGLVGRQAAAVRQHEHRVARGESRARGRRARTWSPPRRRARIASRWDRRPARRCAARSAPAPSGCVAPLHAIRHRAHSRTPSRHTGTRAHRDHRRGRLPRRPPGAGVARRRRARHSPVRHRRR